MKRGEVWWVSFDPTRGGEISKTRPAIVVSANEANRHLNRVTVVPLTSSTGRLYVSEALVQIGGRSSKAAADQIRTIAKERVGSRIGSITSGELKALDAAMKSHLALR